MAFDKIFQGTPGASAPVDAPGTLQSPALGIDVVNNELYVSAGKGWQELGAGGGGGVSSLIAGSGISLSPSGGTGDVTVSATGGGGGNLSGTLTPGVYPVATATHTVGDGTIDYGVTSPDGLAIANAGIGGTTITDSGGGGISITSMGVGGNIGVVTNGAFVVDVIGDVLVYAGDSSPAPASVVQITNNGTGGTSITDGGGGGISLQESASGGIDIAVSNGDGNLVLENPSGGSGGINIVNTGTGGTFIIDSGGGGISLNPGAANVTIGGLIVPGTIYSVAGTPLPTPTTELAGAMAVVSDAFLPTYLGLYVSGGTVTARVLCDGTQWVTA